MQTLKAPFSAVRTFWADDQRRRTLMWVIFALSVAVIAVGAFLAITGQIDYRSKSKDVDKIDAQIDALTAQYPKKIDEADGKLKPDLTGASQAEIDLIAQMLAPMKQQERQFLNDRADAFNQRSTGIRIIGFGVIGLAFAYLVKPDPKKPEEDAAAPDLPAPGGSDT